MTKQSHRTSKVVHQQPNPYDLPPAPPSPAASTKSVESHHSNWSLDSVPINLPNAPAMITMTQGKPISTSIDLLIRPSWIDAEVALIQIEKGKAYGNKSALWLRSLVQGRFYELGQFIQLNAGQLLFIACLVLATLLIGLRSVDLETRVEKLWIEEGGRLEKELRYLRQTLGDGAGITNQIIIQTPKAQSSSVLHQNALLLHLQVMRIALTTTVEMFDTTWDIKDICYTANAPNFENPVLDSVIEHLMPCSIITPLDCFWDGSKLQGPYSPRTVHVPGVAMPVQWTSLNPEILMGSMVSLLNSQKKLDASSNYIEMVQKFMARAGITTAYQKKPCLDPNDGLCPRTAPNHDLATTPDIGGELTGGCYGFATNYMHWAEELIVGGVTKNRSGHIVKARALQSVVQLMGEQNMYEYYKDHYKVHNLDWSIAKARHILEDWQRKFAYEVRRFMATTDFAGSRHYDFHLFTSTSLTDIMSEHSNLNPTRLAVGFVLILLYVGFALSRWRRVPYRMEKSQCFLGMFGVSILGLAGAAGAGVCGFIGLQFNVASTQIVPFFALGLGIDNMFLLAATYASEYIIRHVPHESRTAECLKQTGPSILLSSFCTVAAFLAAAIIPIPALRCFALQTAILITFISVAVIVLFPALASIDLRFRSLYLSQTSHSLSNLSLSTTFFANLWFYLCCCRAPRMSKLASHLSPPTLSPHTSSHIFRQPYLYKQPYNCYYLNSIQTVQESEHCEGSTKPGDGICRCEAGKKILENSDEMKRLVSRKCSQCGGDLRTQCDGQDEEVVVVEKIDQSNVKATQQETIEQRFTWKQLVARFYAPLLQRRAVKVLVLLFYMVVTVMAVLGALRVNDGLDLTDIVPKSSMEHRFLEAQQKYFTYYNVFAVTKGNFDYPNNQRLLYEYHASFTRIGAIIKNDDGGPPDFWLSMFRDWLEDLQQAFDQDWARGYITRDNWFPNASSDGIMAYKLLVQTGRVDNPVDKSLVLKGRLVDDQGIINPKAFYNYLSAWVTVDPLAYETSQASLHPEPREWRTRMPFEVELKIPKSQPLQFTQIPFQLVNIRTTEDIVSTVEEIRAICTRFEDRGLPNFPTGVPFTYWEQYIRLRFYLFTALVAILSGIFVYTSILLVSPWTAFLLVLVLVLNVAHLFGLMGWLGIRLSAIPAVILIASIGVSLSPLMHITLSFLTSIGDRNRRMSLALTHMATPVKHAILSTMVGISLLAFSEFEFIIRYFFYLLALFAVITFLNSFLLLPVLLSMVGPLAEVIPLEHADRISTPSPPPSPLGPPMCPSYLDVLLDPPPRVRKSRRMHSTCNSGSASGAGNVFQRYRSRRVPHRVQSEISLSTISEEPNSYQSTPTPTPPMCRGTTPSNMTPLASNSSPPHEIVVQPEFVVETTITNKGGCNATTSMSPTSVAGSSSSASSEATTSPSPTSSDRDSPSGRSESTTSGKTSRCGSAASFTTTTTTTEQQSQSTTVKVMTTAKLTVELPPGGNAYSNQMASYPGVWLPPPGSAVPSSVHHYHPAHHHPAGHSSCLSCQQASFDFGPSLYRTDAWNHGMIGQNQSSSQMPRGQSHRHSYWR